jgi:YYY domain-containing protein
MNTAWMILTWVAATEALTLATWPLARRALPGTLDRGWAASRVMSLMLLSVAIGAAAMLHLVDFERSTLLAFVAIGGSLVWLASCPRIGPRRLPRELLVGEAVFLGTLGIALALRALFPSVDNNERPMDFAFLDAFVRAGSLPPPDPWFAGQPISYYTLGYLSWASVTRLSGVPVEVAYNLAVASVFAVAASAVWATAGSWRGRVSDGFLAAATFGLVGNLRTLVDWLIMLGAGSADWWASWSTSVAAAAPDPGWIFWLQASRVIPNSALGGITEFPFFSLIVGDLHPHYMAMGLNVLAVAVALAGFRGGPLVLLLPLAAATVAALAAANTWNVPAAAAIMAAGLVCRGGWPRRGLRAAATVLAILLLASALLSAPLLRGTTPPPLGLGLTPRADRLWPGTFLVLFLPFVFGLGAVVLARAPRWRGWPPALAAWALASVVAEVLAGAGVMVFVGGAAFGLGLLAVRALRSDQPVEAGLLATCAVAAGLVCVPELAFLNDYFGTRLNTVFKAYFQALLFLSVGLPPLLSAAPRLLPASGRTRLLTALRRGAIYSAALTLLYVPLAPFTRMSASPPGGTLDGLAFLNTRAPDDLAAIEWLRTVAPRGSVILEAVDEHDPVGAARPDLGRFSAFSGQPTVVGWVEHEQQWRGRLAAIDERVEQVNALFQTDSADEASDLLARYGVAFVVVGQTEHERYGPSVDERLRRGLEPVFRSGETTVYRVPEPVVAGSAR